MKRLILRGSGWTCLAALVLSSGACEAIQGLRPATLETGGANTTGGAGTGGTGGTTTAGGAAGTGGSQECEPGSFIDCYTGLPADTISKGICHGGTKMCNVDGSGYEDVCVGEQTPEVETCTSEEDEDCDSLECARWANAHGDESDQRVSAVASDGSDEFFVAGNFAGTMAFGSVAIGANADDFYLAKVGTDGKGIWAKSFDLAAFDINHYVASVRADVEGNVYLSGLTELSVDFGNGSDLFGVFLSKFSAEGALLWSTGYSDPNSEYDIPGGASVDSTKAVIVLGASECASTCVPPYATTWVRKYTADGSFAWMTSFAEGGAGSRLPSDVVLDPFDNAIVTGGFSGKENFNKGGDVNSAGSSDAFIVKLDSSGGTVWAGHFGDDADQSGVALATDKSGNVYWLGRFAGNIQFGAAAPLLMSAGDDDLFLVKFSSAKVLLWSKSLSGSGKQTAGGLAVDADGNVVVTGSTAGSIDFGGGAVPALGGEAAFVAKLDTDGVPIWNRVFGDGIKQFGRGVAIGVDGGPFLVGNMQGTMNVGGQQLTSQGGYDVFVARLAP